MSCETETATTLRGAGQKVTLQRILILCAVRHAGHHVSVPDILAEIRRSHPYIDASTVYRTLASARELRLVSETHMGTGDNQFEWIGQDSHHHLVCRSCGNVTSLDSSYLDGLATALMDHLGFEADLGHFAISGVCASCRDKRGA